MKQSKTMKMLDADSYIESVHKLTFALCHSGFRRNDKNSDFINRHYIE